MGNRSVSISGVFYEVEPDLAGEKVVLWWGLFDHQLYVEHREQRYGPYTPVGGPIPLHHYRQFKRTRTQKRADKIERLAKQLAVVRGKGGIELSSGEGNVIELKIQSFVDPDPFD